MNRCMTAASAVLLATTAHGAPVQRKPGASKAQPAATPGRLYDFKGVRLGIGMDEFRALPHPDGRPAKVVCTGEKAGDDRFASEPVDVMVFNAEEKALGVRKCIWVTTGEQYLNGRTSGLAIAASGYAANSYSFSFIADPMDGVMRLYGFDGRTNVSAFGDALEALTAKFGTPRVDKGTIQNKMGNSFDQTTAVWANPLSSLTIQSRWSKIDDMGILMTDERLQKLVRDARAAKKANTPNPI